MFSGKDLADLSGLTRRSIQTWVDGDVLIGSGQPPYFSMPELEIACALAPLTTAKLLTPTMREIASAIRETLAEHRAKKPTEWRDAARAFDAALDQSGANTFAYLGVVMGLPNPAGNAQVRSLTGGRRMEELARRAETMLDASSSLLVIDLWKALQPVRDAEKETQQ